MTAYCDLDPAAASALREAAGVPGPAFTDIETLREHLSLTVDEGSVVLGPSVAEDDALKLAESMRVMRHTVGVLLVRHSVDTRVLTDAIRAGVREVIDVKELRELAGVVRRSEALSAAMRESAGLPSHAEPGVTARVVTVFSAKGGCGKTTLATNLAAALADRGRRQVCLVDLDLAFGDVAIALQLFPAHTIADAIPLGDGVDASAVHALLTPHSPGLTTLVAPLEPGSAESVPATLVGHILDVLRGSFDYIVIDTPPAFDDQVLAAFDVSDVVALIATLDVPALKNLKLTLETLDLLNFPRERWRIVLNRADSKVGLAISEVEKTLRNPIAAQIPSSRDVPAAINRGVPIMIDDPKHPVSNAIRAFGERHVVASAGDSPIPQDLRSDRRGMRRRRGGRTS